MIGLQSKVWEPWDFTSINIFVRCHNVKHKQENRLIKDFVLPTAITPPPDSIAAIIMC